MVNLFSPKSLPSMIALANLVFFFIFVTSSATSKSLSGCYESIISFGDSLADTGNLIRLTPSNKPRPRSSLPPYGETFFHCPTGRYSDGRLVIDFIAESLGLPLAQPYVGWENTNMTSSEVLRKGVNFAVAGATALDHQFLEERGIYNPGTNVSLGTQLDWFKHFLDTLSDGKEFLKSSLIVVGEIGGNDYNHPLTQGMDSEVIRSLVPAVVNYVGLSIQELIKLGAETILVPGNLPIGCLPMYLTKFKTVNEQDYDPKTGCLNWLDKLSEYHNELLIKELSRVQELYPRAVIIYADYYNAAMRLYLSPNEFGFTKGILKACCGGGGPYNYNTSAICATPQATSCDDPSSYASWDGLHFTEAAYRWITQGLLEGPYTIPQITTICSSPSSRIAGLHEYVNKNQVQGEDGSGWSRKIR